MTFIDLDTEEANDIIEVRDGKEKDYVLGQFSGSKDVKLIQPIFSTTKVFGSNFNQISWIQKEDLKLWLEQVTQRRI